MKRSTLWAFVVAVCLSLPHWIEARVLQTTGLDAFVPLFLSFGFFLGLPLYARIAREAVLDNPTRRRIRDAVAEKPGQSLQDVQKSLGIGWGTTMHHVERLLQARVLVSETAGRRRLLFLADAQRSLRDAHTLVTTDGQRRLLEFVARNPGCSQQEAAHGAGLSLPLAHRYLARIEARGFVESSKRWRTRSYQPTPALVAQLGQTAERPTSHSTQGPSDPLPPATVVSLAGTSAP